MRTAKEIAGGSLNQFDVATDFSDHSYANKVSKSYDGFTDSSSDLSKRIMREWRTLKKDLPEAISVRVYEKRLDLLRAVIVGAQKTPYHDGLYFFDIQFPSDYPNDPPAVNYLSHGLRINPNLYASGYVCLSLLNTWHGQGHEKWNSTSSTILQVLVSLQGLVLNERPYYNEPLTRLDMALSNTYNEEVFYSCCKSTLFLLRNPPLNFRNLVFEHFKLRARTILRACQAYRFGDAQVGYFADDDGSDINLSQEREGIQVHWLLRRRLDDIYPQLFSAFKEIGAPLEDLPKELMMVSKAKTLKSKGQNQKKASVVFWGVVSLCIIWGFSRLKQQR